MIWVEGRIVPDDALKISVLDRTFEHGLGLFETFRTWNGHATLLDRHLARMTNSARELKLPLDPAQLPNRDAVAALLLADHCECDAMLRITMSGGLSEETGSTVWMRAFPSPEPGPVSGAAIQHEYVSFHGPLARHKTLNYWDRRLSYERVRSFGFDEVLSQSSDGYFLEGSRTNLFLAHESGYLLTPRADGPILSGIMRGVVLEWAAQLDLSIDESGIQSSTISRANEAFLTNSVRGIIPVHKLGTHTFRSPGHWTTTLWDAIRPWLESGGTDESEGTDS